jgi:hypothetical protein
MRSGVAALGSKPGAARLMAIVLVYACAKRRCCDKGIEEVDSDDLLQLLVDGQGKLLADGSRKHVKSAWQWSAHVRGSPNLRDALAEFHSFDRTLMACVFFLETC